MVAISGSRSNCLTALVVLALLFLVSGSAGSASAKPKTLMSCGTPPTYWPSTGSRFPADIKYRLRPKQCLYSHDGTSMTMVILKKLKWQGWGGPRARATGYWEELHGLMRLHPATVTLSRPKLFLNKRGKAHRYYQRMVLRSPDLPRKYVWKLHYPGRGAVKGGSIRP